MIFLGKFYTTNLPKEKSAVPLLSFSPDGCSARGCVAEGLITQHARFDIAVTLGLLPKKVLARRKKVFFFWQKSKSCKKEILLPWYRP
jgi:hypothetical protein